MIPAQNVTTILRRLLETPETKAAEREAKKAKKADNLEPEEDSEAKPLSSPSLKAKKAKSEKADDSSSECETASIASSTASLSRKRKRSMTDFPPKKKAKKESVLPAKKQPKSIKKGLQSPTVSKKLRQQQASPPNSRTSKNKNQQNLKSPKPKPKRMMKLCLKKRSVVVLLAKTKIIKKFKKTRQKTPCQKLSKMKSRQPIQTPILIPMLNKMMILRKKKVLLKICLLKRGAVLSAKTKIRQCRNRQGRQW